MRISTQYNIVTPLARSATRRIGGYQKTKSISENKHDAAKAENPEVPITWYSITKMIRNNINVIMIASSNILLCVYIVEKL